MAGVSTRPIVDMRNTVADNSKALARAAMVFLGKHPQSKLEEVIEMLIFSMFEIDEIEEPLEHKILTSMGQSFNCQIINVELDEERQAAEDKVLDNALDGGDLDDGPVTFAPMDLELVLQNDSEEDD